jgi:hypothetical protein
MIRHLLILALITSALFIQCNKSTKDALDVPVVTIEGKTLTLRQLKNAIPENLSKEDSTLFVQDYMNKWVKTQLILRQAELNLSDEEKNVEQLLEEYRTSLLSHQYLQKMLEQKYSPLITSSETDIYYKNMKDNFKLNEVIIKGVFVKVSKNVPEQRELEKWLTNTDPQNLVKIEAFCFQNAKIYDQFIDEWTPLSKLIIELPSAITDPGNYFKTHKFYMTNDMEYNYYIAVKQIMMEDEIAPYEYSLNKIKSIILNKKRVEFIHQLENDLYEEGLEQKIVKFH